MSRQDDIIINLKAGAAATAEYYRSLAQSKLDVQVYSDGAAWTVKQVLAHLTPIEGSMHRLFKNILEGGPGSGPEFDIDRFNRSQPAKLDGLTLGQLLDRFAAVRDETIAIVSGMRESDLDRRGRHPFHGDGTLERFVRWAYEHAALHEEDIRRALSNLT